MATRAGESELADLIVGVAGGDRKAMAALYEASAPILFGIVHALARDPAAAAQLTEGVYLRIWDRAPRFNPGEGEARSWLSALARGAAVDWRRRVPGGSAVAAAELVLSDETMLTGDAPIAWGNAATLLHYRLRELPLDDQAAIRAAMLTGASYSEIAQAALVGAETVRQQARSGLAALEGGNPGARPVDPALARELALGAIDGEQRAQALRTQLSDPVFAAEVERWQQLLAPVLEALPASDPPELWTRIDALIDLREGDAPRRMRRRQMRWPVARTTAIGLAAALAGALVAMAIFTFALGGLQPQPPGAAPVLVAQTAGPDRRPDLAIRYDPAGSAVRVRARRFDSAQGVVDLWLMASDGTPYFLGRITDNGFRRFPLPRTIQKLIVDGATVMVTVAPAGTARRSEPSGRVIASARFVLV